MKSIEQFRKVLSHHLPELKKQYGINTLEFFGSRIYEGLWTPESDLDILVSFARTPSLLEFVELKNYLSDMLGVKVDLVMKEALKPGIRERIMEERVAV